MADFAVKPSILGWPSSVRRDAFVPVVAEQLSASRRGAYSNSQDGAYQVYAYPRSGSECYDLSSIRKEGQHPDPAKHVVFAVVSHVCDDSSGVLVDS